MLSDSESELFITQSSFSGSTSIELSENNFESLFAGADNEKAVENFNLRIEDLLTDLFTDKEDSDRGITTVTDKKIQASFHEFAVLNHQNVRFIYREICDLKIAHLQIANARFLLFIYRRVRYCAIYKSLSVLSCDL